MKIGTNLISIQSHFNIVDNLQAILHRHFKNIKIYLFGSRINGTGTEGSDLDIFIDIGMCIINFKLKIYFIILFRVDNTFLLFDSVRKLFIV